MERKKYTSLKLTVAGIVAALGLSNCTTTYDAYGRPVQTADPAAVAIGAIALGATAYAIGKNNGTKHKYYSGHRGHHVQHIPRGHRGHRGHR